MYAIEKLRQVGCHKIEYNEYRHCRPHHCLSTLTPNNEIILLIGFDRDLYTFYQRDKKFDYVFKLYKGQKLTKTLDLNDINRIECIRASNKYIYFGNCDSKMLFVYNYDLNLVKSVALSFYPMMLIISDKFLYVLLHHFQKPIIHVIDTNNNNEINAFGQSENSKDPYYINDDNIEIQNNYLFICNHAKFSIMSIATGFVIKKFYLTEPVFYFKVLPCSLNRILFLNSDKKSFEIYDWDGNLVETVETAFKIKNFLNFCINENFQVVFNDCYNKILYTN